MRLKIALSTAVAVLIATQAGRGWADRGQGKGKKDQEVTTNFQKQFEWESRVVGPKEGLDHDKLAAIQQKGRKEDEARKKEPPKKVERAAGLNEAGSVALPTMDIEKPAAKKSPAAKKEIATAPAPRRKDSLDNLLDEQGVKAYTPPTGKKSNDNAGLDNLFASDDKSSGGGSARKGKKTAKRR